nr:filamentous haemagglutinin family protein [Acinetobacter sp. Marseille-Q1620]
MKIKKQRHTALTLDKPKAVSPLLTQRFSAQGVLRYFIRLSHISLGLFVIYPTSTVFAAPTFGSAAWFSQAGAAAANPARAATAAASRPNVIGAVNTPQQAAQRTQRTMGDMSRTLQAIVSAQQAQSAAHQLSINTPNNIPNGLGSGGLQVADGVGKDATLWQNAKLPTQEVKDGKTQVKIEQTDQKAILSWKQFNVGTDTVVHFDQSAGKQVNGANEWVALNRIYDASPSKIFGQIKAEGSVYLLNNSGFIFGGSSKVNTHSFLVSSLDLLDSNINRSNERFLKEGLPISQSSTPLLLNGATYSGSYLDGELLSARGAITIDKGASINTGENGFNLIAAPKLTNDGVVNATRGQIILAAGTELYNASRNDGKNNEINARLGENGGALTNTGLVQNSEGNITLLGKNISQDGAVGTTTGITRTGSINILAQENRYGTVYPNQIGRIDFGEDSVTTILPSSNNETTTSSDEATKAVKPAELNFSAGSVLFNSNSLVLAPSANLNINTYFKKANSTTNDTVQNQSDITPNLDMVTGRIWLAPEATLNVAGLADVSASVADTLIQLPRIGLNELADSPLLRDSFLYTNTGVTVDGSLSGTREDGLNWQGSPILNIKGYIEQIPRNIKQLQINGGTVNLVGNELITQKNSLINIDGGYIHYKAGNAPVTTKLQGADGGIYDIGSADANFDYTGFAGQHIVSQERWGTKQSYIDPLVSGQVATYHPAYIEGGNAGNLNLFFTKTAFLEGDINAYSYAGLKQILSSNQPHGGKLTVNDPSLELLQKNIDISISTGLPITPSLFLTSNENIKDLISTAHDFVPTKDLFADTKFNLLTEKWEVPSVSEPENILNSNFWTQLSTDSFNNTGLSVLSFNAPEGKIFIDKNTSLTVQAGGQINIKAGQVSVDGELNAVAGKININTAKPMGLYPSRIGTIFYPTEADKKKVPQKADLIIGENATLNTRGQWVNDNGLSMEELTGKQYINGGSINLTTQASSNVFTNDNGQVQVLDTTGSITLNKGSVLDVSSGGYITPQGQLLTKDNVAQGKAGDITLKVYDKWFSIPNTGNNPPDKPDVLPTEGKIQMDGTLYSFGFAGGGTLNIQALGIEISNQNPEVTNHHTEMNNSQKYNKLWLQPEFFTTQGFSSYKLQSLYDTTIKSDTIIKPVQLSYIPDLSRLLQTETGQDLKISQSSEIGLLDNYHRPATHLSLAAGLLHTTNAQYKTADGSDLRTSLTMEKGSEIIADAGALVTLDSTDQIDIEGKVQAHGGQIKILGDTADLGYRDQTVLSYGKGFTASNKGIRLGEESVLDVSGTTLLDPLAKPEIINDVLTTPKTGKVLAGGSVIISNDTGYIAAAPGAKIDVSGTSNTFDMVQSNNGFERIQPTDVWSDAGSITIAAGKGLYFDGRLSAKAGSNNARGGSLNISALDPANSKGIVLSQTGSFTKTAGLNASGQTPDAPQGVLYFALDTLKGTGIDNLNINTDPNYQNISNSVVPLKITTPVYFQGNIDLDLKGSLVLTSPQLVALGHSDRQDGQLTNPEVVSPGFTDTHNSQVKLNAAYIKFRGTKNEPILAARGNSQLTASANFIDLEGNLSLAHFKEANFNSQGDIRLSQLQLANTVPQAGSLYTSGNLNFTAAQLYPTTANSFVLLANANPDSTEPAVDEQGKVLETKITIKGNGHQSPLPLSAGGKLLVDANYIEQAGVLRAPAGQLILGVNDPNNASTQAEFSNLPLTKTLKLDVRPESISSVSLGGKDMTIPYGQTEDGKAWQYFNGIEMVNVPAPPEKKISFSADQVSLQDGALVDLSGGGHLQAIEWIPGTGGTRDLLSQNNITYVNGADGKKIAQNSPLYPDQRGVYAIIPGYLSPIAAYDPYFAQGQAPIGIGQQVYLTGTKDFAEGYYTLLPAKYATLPGAYRIVAQPERGSLASQNVTRPDGTQLISGYWADGLTGARDAISTRFEVQARPVWGQYSEYTTTTADSFFLNQAQRAGQPAPQLMRDAGQLVLAATKTLDLGAKLNTAADEKGVKAQVDIASEAIQVIGNDNSNTLKDHLQIKAKDLNELDAGSLMLGGTRRQVTEGTQVNTLATSVVVSNDKNSALEVPEIILVSKPDANPSTNTAGIKIDQGSVINAKGELAASSVKPLIFGEKATENTTGLSGDGSMLRLSNAGHAVINRHNLPQDDLGQSTAQGSIRIDKGAILNGGKSLTVDTTHTSLVDGTAELSAASIALNSGKIAITDDLSLGQNYDGLLIGPSSLDKFAKSEQLILSSYSSMDFLGNVNLNLNKSLNLSAGTFSGTGGTVNINADHLTLENTLNATRVENLSTESNNAGIHFNARQITFGQGDKKTAGFSNATVTAKDLVDVSGKGKFDFDGATVAINTPVLIANQGSDNSIQTTRTLTLQTNGEINKDVDAIRPLGGKVNLIGSNIESNLKIRANSGQINLTATQQDLKLQNGSLLDVSGTAKKFFDINAYAPAGTISLVSDKGHLQLDSGATIDISANKDGGNAGVLTTKAAKSINLAGTLKGDAAKGKGGSLNLDSGNAVDLNTLSQQLANSGINQAISVTSHQGNLTLSKDQKITAREITLTADGGHGNSANALESNHGNVIIDGVIDASTQTTGQAGGKITLSGKSGVAVDGQLLASTTDKNQRGGTVTLNTTGKTDGTLNADYGYQNVNVADSGKITLGSQAVIDVSGGTDRGLSGGTVNMRAPLLSDGDVRIDIAPDAQIKGARDVGINAYAVWSTTDNSSNPNQHFDGIVDPAGWYDKNGKLLSGNFIDSSGEVKATSAGLSDEQIDEYLAKYTFVPDQTNKQHQSFYGYIDGDSEKAVAGTLMSFVQKPKFSFESRFDKINNFHARPEIELINPAANINNGDISVVTPWNLAAGKLEGNLVKLDYRYKDQAPMLSLRAEKDVNINASISDGFFQFTNPLGGKGFSESTFEQANSNINTTKNTISSEEIVNMFGLTFDFSSIMAPETVFTSEDPSLVAQYYGAYEEYLKTLSSPNILIGIYGMKVSPYAFVEGLPQLVSTIGSSAAPAIPKTLGEYPAYLANWQKYIQTISDGFDGNSLPSIEKLAPPPTILTASGGSTDNSPSPIQVSMPLSNLLGGQSSSYRFIAGSDFISSNPELLNPNTEQGSINIDGYTVYEHSEIDRKQYLPTMLRTGIGSIDLIAAQDLKLQNAFAPGVIYTAGQPSVGSKSIQTSKIENLHDPLNKLQQGIFVTGSVNPDAAGDINIHVGHDIISNEHHIDVDGKITGIAGSSLTQHWWQWMQTGNPFIVRNANVAENSSINFGNFSQGIMSVGGNISVEAGRDIKELSVSLPTTWFFDNADRSSYTTVGGGSLNLNAGRDILSGQYFISKGEGNIFAGGSVSTSDQLLGTHKTATLLALQDATLNVSALQDLNIGHIYNPSYLFSFGYDSAKTPFSNFSAIDMQPYSTKSTVNLSTLAGNINFNTVADTGSLYGSTLKTESGDNILPATLNMTALNGGIQIEGGGTLFPAAKGTINLIAENSINMTVSNLASNRLGLSDFVADSTGVEAIPTPINQYLLATKGYPIQRFPASSTAANNGSTLHAEDKNPLRIYSLSGSVINGKPFGDTGTWYAQMDLLSPKLAQIYAGSDIVNLLFHGQNLHSADSTRIVAGHDIVNMPLTNYRDSGDFVQIPAIVLGGSGTLDVSAGRDIGALANPISALKQGVLASKINTADFGIMTTGNRDNRALPVDGANLNIKFGVAPGIQTQEFIQRYIAPTATNTGLPGFSDDLVKYMQDYKLGQKPNTGLVRDRIAEPMTQEQAWTEFQKLSLDKQQIFVDQVFNKILAITAKDYNDPASPNFQKYARGYEAINTLYPAELGYTKNNLSGGALGATETINTGNLDMRNTTLQTQQGGNISISAPGGELLIGSSSAPPADKPSSSGIIAAREGDVNIFSDRSVLLAQSRIFALQGGDMMIWSSNGDINAGKGAKTTSELAQVSYMCSLYYYCQLDAINQVSGAGIAAMQTIPDAESGDTYLVAPRGTVDAGDAGIRVSGNIYVAAQQVANADNIQVQGESVGVPVAAQVDTGALAAASNAAAAAAQQSTAMNNAANNKADTMISVEIVGFGGPKANDCPVDETGKPQCRNKTGQGH